jgi:hypothetical protein
MRFLLVILMLISATARGEESWQSLVDDAFGRIEKDLKTDWSYTETTVNSTGRIVARFDPRNDSPWHLVSVDGREPTTEETDAFNDERAGAEGSGDGDAGSVVADGTLELLEETDSYWRFAFTPEADEAEAAFMQSVEGTLTVRKDGEYVSQVSLRNTAPIKPGKGVKIKKFETLLEFAPIGGDGPVLPRRIAVEIQGRALLVVGIDEKESIEFGDYEWVGAKDPERTQPAHP